MLPPKQIDLVFGDPVVAGIGDPGRIALARDPEVTGVIDPGHNSANHEVDLESNARDLLRSLGAGNFAHKLRVEWNPRLKTCAGRANYRQKLITLNPRLVHHPAEVDRTFRHELAHLLAQFRTGRRRIFPHGVEWRQACRDLGIGDEKCCHSLPLAGNTRRRRFLRRI